MPRIVLSLFFFVAVSLPAFAEEISLKDGTKIVGHMTALTADKVEIETSYGKMQLKRTEIVTISFPENAPRNAPDATPVKVDSPKVDEVLQGPRYLNRTGKFSLTVPQQWAINTDLQRSASTLTVLNSADKMRFMMVLQEEYPGSLESYKELTMLNARKSLANFDETAVSNVSIDGKAALLVFYRGVPQKAAFPLAFVSAIIPSGNSFTKMTIWCVEPLFHDMQPTFEKILMSYHTTTLTTTAAAASKP
jgi:hypothetical protein